MMAERTPQSRGRPRLNGWFVGFSCGSHGRDYMVVRRC
jgi:hypothetical protein